MVTRDVNRGLCSACCFGANKRNFEGRRVFAVDLVGYANSGIVFECIRTLIGVEYFREVFGGKHAGISGMFFGDIHIGVASEDNPIGSRGCELLLTEEITFSGCPDENGTLDGHVRSVVLNIDTGHDTGQFYFAFQARNDG